MICQICHRKPAKHKHHLLSQTAVYRHLYNDLIDDPRNLMEVCIDCHMSKSLKKLTEESFCRIMGVKPRSKSLQNKIMSGRLEDFWTNINQVR
jgi:hypothetical protein